MSNNEKPTPLRVYEDALNFRINALFALLADQFAGVEEFKKQGNITLMRYDTGVFLAQIQQMQQHYQKNYESGKTSIVSLNGKQG